MNKQNQNIIFNHSNVDLSVNNYGQLYGSAINLGLAEIIKNHQNFKIVIAPEINSAETLCNELKYVVGPDLSIEFLPDLNDYYKYVRPLKCERSHLPPRQ